MGYTPMSIPEKVFTRGSDWSRKITLLCSSCDADGWCLYRRFSVGFFDGGEFDQLLIWLNEMHLWII